MLSDCRASHKEQRQVKIFGEKFTVPAKHNPTTEEIQDYAHPAAEGGGYGGKTCDQKIATLSESKPVK